jgi:hypothetical protein
LPLFAPTITRQLRREAIARISGLFPFFFNLTSVYFQCHGYFFQMVIIE